MSDPPEVSVVVVSYEAREALLACLTALASSSTRLETIVVDNASGDGSPDAVRRRFPAVRLAVNRDNRGFAAACNQGASLATAPFLLFLNSDAEVGEETIDVLLRRLRARPEAAAAGPRTVFADGGVQVSFGPDLGPWREWEQRRLVTGARRGRPGALRRAEALAAREHEPDWVSGSCLLVRSAAFHGVGGFDEGFFLYEEDADLCLRLRRGGWRILFTPAAEVRHHLGRSMARAPSRAALEYHRSHLRYYRKHRGPFATVALRAWLLGRAGLDALRGRSEWRSLARLALTKR